MIVDNIKNAGLYTCMGEGIAKALKFLQTNDQGLNPGKYMIDGDDVFILVNEYETKPSKEVQWEAHKKYIDIQFVIEGRENIGYAHKDSLLITKEYEEKEDCLLLAGTGSAITCIAGTFVIFMPEDAHRPGLSLGASGKVKKAVAKVKVLR